MWGTLTYLQRYSSLKSLARARTDKFGGGIVAILRRSTGFCIHLHEASSTSFTSLYDDLPHFGMNAFAMYVISIEEQSVAVTPMALPPISSLSFVAAFHG